MSNLTRKAPPKSARHFYPHKKCQALFGVLLIVGGAAGVGAEEAPEGLRRDLDVPFTDERTGDAFSLDEVTRIAVADSLDINILRIDREIKQEELRSAKAVYDIELTVDGEYEIDEEQPASTIFGSRAVTGEVETTVERLLPTGTELTFTHSASRESTQSPFAALSRLYKGSAEIAVTQPILQNSFGLIDRGKVEQVRLDVARFDYETADRIEARVLAARNAYWDLVFAHMNLESKRRALRQAQEFLRTMEEKLDLGLIERQDVFAAEANVRLRIIDALEAQTVLTNGRETLQVLLDLPPDVRLVPTTAPEFEVVSVDVDRSLERAFGQRRDYHQLKLDLELGDLAVRMKRSGLLPQLDLEGSYRSSGLDRDLADAQGEIGGFNHPTLFTGFTFSVPLENREAGAAFRQARLARQRVELSLRRLERRITREIREACRAVLLEAARVTQTQQAQILQRDKLTEEDKVFQYGRSDSRTIIDFQEDVIEAERQAQLALVSYRKSRDALLRAEHHLLEATGVTGP